jgi:inhibitor of KinA sporulation pathway (predicted exonuclease)
MTDENARKVMNAIIPDLIIQTGHDSPDEHPLAGCDQPADTKTLNARKHHYHKTATDFGFAVKQRQTEVKFKYREES